jgi:cytochrome c biogenesis protein CcdA
LFCLFPSFFTFYVTHKKLATSSLWAAFLGLISLSLCILGVLPAAHIKIQTGVPRAEEGPAVIAQLRVIMRVLSRIQPNPLTPRL